MLTRFLVSQGAGTVGDRTLSKNRVAVLARKLVELTPKKGLGVLRPTAKRATDRPLPKSLSDLCTCQGRQASLIALFGPHQ